MKEKIQALLDLCAKSDLDPLVSTHIINPGYTHLANLTETLDNGGRGRCLAMIPKEWSDYVAATVTAFPALGTLLLALLEEREAWQLYRDTRTDSDLSFANEAKEKVEEMLKDGGR